MRELIPDIAFFDIFVEKILSMRELIPDIAFFDMFVEKILSMCELVRVGVGI